MDCVPVSCPRVADLSLLTNIWFGVLFLHFSKNGHKIYIRYTCRVHTWRSSGYILHHSMMEWCGMQPARTRCGLLLTRFHVWLLCHSQVIYTWWLGWVATTMLSQITKVYLSTTNFYQVVLGTTLYTYPHRPEHCNMCPFTVRNHQWTEMPWKW